MAVGNGSSIAALGADPIRYAGNGMAIDAPGNAEPGGDAQAGPVPSVAPLGMEGEETLLTSIDVVGNAFLSVGARRDALTWGAWASTWVRPPKQPSSSCRASPWSPATRSRSTASSKASSPSWVR